MRNRIKVQRAILDITQAELAERLRVSRSAINAIEKRRYVPSTLLALKMARLFNTNVEEIFFLEDDD